MGRFEAALPTADDNLAAMSDPSGMWIDRVGARKPPKHVMLDFDGSESAGPYGEQEAQPATATSAVLATGRFSRSTSSATWSGAIRARGTRVVPRHASACTDHNRSRVITGNQKTPTDCALGHSQSASTRW
jgi:hypothetical protein